MLCPEVKAYAGVTRRPQYIYHTGSDLRSKRRSSQGQKSNFSAPKPDSLLCHPPRQICRCLAASWLAASLRWQPGAQEAFCYPTFAAAAQRATAAAARPPQNKGAKSRPCGTGRRQRSPHQLYPASAAATLRVGEPPRGPPLVAPTLRRPVQNQGCQVASMRHKLVAAVAASTSSCTPRCITVPPSMPRVPGAGASCNRSQKKR